MHLVQRAVLAFVRDLSALAVGIDALYRTARRATSIAATKDRALKHRIFRSPVAKRTVIVSVINLR
ncbi:hypothetical protein CQ062_24150 [Ochrobactrum sp. MYb68]|nr:hypothetical protein CQ062_24150 [Ochrobactrum sp. MYb68]